MRARRRLVLSRMEVAIGVDAALAAMRNYFERAARELHARGGRILPRNGAPPPSLQEQEEALAAWYTFLVTRLRVFKVRPSCCCVLAILASRVMPRQVHNRRTIEGTAGGHLGTRPQGIGLGNVLRAP